MFDLLIALSIVGLIIGVVFLVVDIIPEFLEYRRQKNERLFDQRVENSASIFELRELLYQRGSEIRDIKEQLSELKQKVEKK